jgi:predicted DNA binding CopG/RHH family protein
MEFSSFDWDDGNFAKCQRHGVSIAVIESLFERPVAILPDDRHSQSESSDRQGGGWASSLRRLHRAASEQRNLDTSDQRRYMHEKEVRALKKKIPSFETDAETEAFVAEADLSEYDLSGARLVRFELKRKDKSINLRLPEDLLNAVRAQAMKEGIPYQRFIRMVLERAVQSGR